MAHHFESTNVSLASDPQDVITREKQIAGRSKDADAESLELLIKELEEQDGGEKEPDVLSLYNGTETFKDDDTTAPCPYDTDPDRGLTDAEVLAARRKHGWNRMKEHKKRHFWKFLGLFVGPVQFVMEVAAILAAGLQDWIDFGVILGLLLLNACVGFVQEYHAGNIVDSLKETLALKATVIRNGQKFEIRAEEVVPGDVILVDDVILPIAKAALDVLLTD
jgi:H+-transporting ATPase